MALGAAGSSMSFRLLELLKLPPGYWEALDIHALLAGMAVMVEVSRPPPPHRHPGWLRDPQQSASAACPSGGQ